MTVTREELAAFADGELDPAREAEVAAAVAADPELEAQLEAHRTLRARTRSRRRSRPIPPWPSRSGRTGR